MIARTLMILAVATTTLGDSVPRAFPTSKIVGGVTAIDGDVPWQVSIQTAIGSQLYGGVIISPNWILTSAHITSQISPVNHRVRSGTLRYGSGGSVHTISQIVVNPSYSAFNFSGDIALWEVDPPFTYDTNTRNVGLPSLNEDPPAGGVRVSGWGNFREGGGISPNLLWVDVPILSNATCNMEYESNGGLTIDQICAGEDGKGFCQGDVGGPLFEPTSNTLHGIVSWGENCLSVPGVYIKVSHWRDWITSVTGV